WKPPKDKRGMTDRFVVSTGRAGSTLFSRMLAENRKLLVMSEFIACIEPIARLQPGLVSGSELCAILAADDYISVVIGQRGRRSPEVLNDSQGSGQTPLCLPPNLLKLTLAAPTARP